MKTPRFVLEGPLPRDDEIEQNEPPMNIDSS